MQSAVSSLQSPASSLQSSVSGLLSAVSSLQSPACSHSAVSSFQSAVSISSPACNLQSAVVQSSVCSFQSAFPVCSLQPAVQFAAFGLQPRSLNLTVSLPDLFTGALSRTSNCSTSLKIYFFIKWRVKNQFSTCDLSLGRRACHPARFRAGQRLGLRANGAVLGRWFAGGSQTQRLRSTVSEALFVINS